jgi:hypothetical protein
MINFTMLKYYLMPTSISIIFYVSFYNYQVRIFIYNICIYYACMHVCIYYAYMYVCIYVCICNATWRMLVV